MLKKYHRFTGSEEKEMKKKRTGRSTGARYGNVNPSKGPKDKGIGECSVQEIMR